MARVTRRFSVPVWAIKVYEAAPRLKDGKVTWRLVESHHGPSGKEVSARFLAEAQAFATARGLAFRSGVNHGDPVVG